jgi:mono/diheme cytochrome c family protein
MRRVLAILAVLALGAAGTAWLASAPARLEAAAIPQDEGNAERGRAVFHAGGCGSCHATPGQADVYRLGGGLELKTDFGSFFAPNISPDPKAGIGSWSKADFLNAVMRGVSPDGRHYYPAFPYTAYARMRPEDAVDLLAFIRTLAPDTTASHPQKLAFPFSIRRGVGLWKSLYLDTRLPPFDEAKGPAWNRGLYLVEALGHCAECHSSRNAFGAVIGDARFAGGPNPDGPGTIPNITPHEDGIADWTEEDIALMLADGFTPEGDTVSGSMEAVIRNTSQLSEDDRRAMAVYLKSLPPRPSPARGEAQAR